MIKVSDYIFQFLKEKGIDTIFSVSGGAAAHLLNSARDGDFQFICNYHEQACAMAAEGYAKIANKPACVLVTNGPGSANTITGVLGAYQDSVPMIIISGQVPVNQSLSSTSLSLRQIGVQECDIISMVSSITKYAVQVIDPNSIQEHLNNAYHLSVTGRKGPVWLDIPLDVQSAFIEPTNLTPFPTEIYNQSNLDDVIDILINASKPLIVIGNGIHLSDTEDEFLRIKNLLQIPVVATWGAKDILPQSDSLYIGNFGLLGERAANFAIQTADVLLILGSRLSIPNIGYRSDLFSPKSVKIMVDVDANELQKHTIKIDYPIHDSLNNFFLNFESKILQKTLPSWTTWAETTQEWKNKYPVFQKEYATIPDKINSFYFMETLSAKINDNHVIVTDMGTSYTCTMQSLQMNGKARLFTSNACCSMGFGMPGAIGAYYANPSKDVILIAGDGGIQMNIQELQTIAHNNIPLKIFILNNNGYLAITLMQDNLFNGKYIGSNMESGVSAPDFVKLGKAYGFDTFKFHNNDELIAGIDEVLNKKGPVICEIAMIENQLLIPRVQSSKDSSGKIISTSLENMFPYLNESELKEIMST